MIVYARTGGTHVHINEPEEHIGRFANATRAAAGVHHYLIEMPLNSILQPLQLAAMEQRSAPPRAMLDRLDSGAEWFPAMCRNPPMPGWLLWIQMLSGIV